LQAVRLFVLLLSQGSGLQCLGGGLQHTEADGGFVWQPRFEFVSNCSCCLD
jgi:hypothetical protein